MRLRLFRGARYVSPTPRARDYLSRPLGRLYRPHELDSLRTVLSSLSRDGVAIATVGDRVTRTLLDILDLLGEVWGERPVLIRISGEEDLVGVPVILFMPESGHVLYGQPLEGVVDVVVTAPLKEELRRLVLGEDGA